MAGELRTPQKRATIRHFLLRPAAMAAELDGAAIHLLRFRQVAERDLDQRQMPAQMAVEKSVARIRREPGQQKGPCRIGFAALVADMGKLSTPERNYIGGPV